MWMEWLCDEIFANRVINLNKDNRFSNNKPWISTKDNPFRKLSSTKLAGKGSYWMTLFWVFKVPKPLLSSSPSITPDFIISKLKAITLIPKGSKSYLQLWLTVLILKASKQSGTPSAQALLPCRFFAIWLKLCLFSSLSTWKTTVSHTNLSNTFVRSSKLTAKLSKLLT